MQESTENTRQFIHYIGHLLTCIGAGLVLGRLSFLGILDTQMSTGIGILVVALSIRIWYIPTKIAQLLTEKATAGKG